MGLLTNGVVQLGIGGLLIVAVTLGLLMPKSTAKMLVDRADKNADQWQVAAEREAARADLAMQQSDQLLAGMETIEKLVRSLVAAREIR